MLIYGSGGTLPTHVVTRRLCADKGKHRVRRSWRGVSGSGPHCHRLDKVVWMFSVACELHQSRDDNILGLTRSEADVIRFQSCHQSLTTSFYYVVKTQSFISIFVLHIHPLLPPLLLSYLFICHRTFIDVVSALRVIAIPTQRLKGANRAMSLSTVDSGA